MAHTRLREVLVDEMFSGFSCTEYSAKNCSNIRRIEDTLLIITSLLLFRCVLACETKIQRLIMVEIC